MIIVKANSNYSARNDLDFGALKKYKRPMKFIPIPNIRTFQGRKPEGYELVAMERGKPETAFVLYGFDEVDLTGHGFRHCVWGFADYRDDSN